MKQQRDVIIEERRMEAERRMERERAEGAKRAAGLKYLEEQISVLQEALEETKRAEAVLEKAQAEELRRTRREQKREARDAMRRVQTQLQRDWEEDRQQPTSVQLRAVKRLH